MMRTALFHLSFPRIIPPIKFHRKGSGVAPLLATSALFPVHAKRKIDERGAAEFEKAKSLVRELAPRDRMSERVRERIERRSVG